MPDTDQQIWKQACERVGVWTDFCVDDNQVHTCQKCGRTDVNFQAMAHSPQKSCPSIGDPASVAAMINYGVRRDLTVCIGPRWVIFHDQRGLNIGEGDVRQGLWLALAAAVLAIPQEKP